MVADPTEEGTTAGGTTDVAVARCWNWWTLRYGQSS